MYVHPLFIRFFLFISACGFAFAVYIFFSLILPNLVFAEEATQERFPITCEGCYLDEVSSMMFDGALTLILKNEGIDTEVTPVRFVAKKITIPYLGEKVNGTSMSFSAFKPDGEHCTGYFRVIGSYTDIDTINLAILTVRFIICENDEY